MANNLLYRLGVYCGDFRRSQGATQISVAVDTGYSVETISSFECGRNNNLTIFLWYVVHGLDVSKIRNIIAEADVYFYLQ